MMRRLRALLLVGGMTGVFIYFIAEHCLIHRKTSSHEVKLSPTNNPSVELLDDDPSPHSQPQGLGYAVLENPAWRRPRRFTPSIKLLSTERPRRSTPSMELLSTELPVNSLVYKALETRRVQNSKPIVAYNRDNSRNLQQDVAPADFTVRHSKQMPPVDSDETEVVSTWKVRSWIKGDAVGLPVSDIPNVTVSSIECAALFAADPDQLKKASEFQLKNSKIAISPEYYALKTRNCSAFVKERRYALHPANDEEAAFPLAYSIVMYKDVEQFERLLRAIYRPQNVYCVHVDNKSSEAIHTAVKSISRCFNNVHLLTPSFSVQWGTFSVLEPELACMQKLLKKNKKWKYFINLTGQEFPLKTNWQIVRILKVFNGTNNMEGTVERRNKERTESMPPPPVNVTLTKGSVHIVAKRAFVDYVINNATSLKFLDWVKNTYIPDETFFSSLNHSPQLGVPGSYLGKPETDTTDYRFITRFKNWGDGPFNWPCYGKRVSMVCIFGVGDLPLLVSRPELYANKFYLDYEPLALDCMEQLFYSRLREDLLGGDSAKFDTSIYASQNFVKNHI